MARRSLASVVTLALLLSLVPLVPVAAAATAPYDPFFAPPATVTEVASLAPVSSSSNRAFGVAVGDYTSDGRPDVVVGRADGRIALAGGNGNGTFAAPALLAWKQTTFNAWAFTSGDVNGDGKLDVVWGSNALSTGCSVSPIPVGGTCVTAGGTTITVNDGDVRAFLGNGNGTFQETAYFVSGVRHNAGVLLGRIAATDAGSVTAGDVDADGDLDVVAGAVDAANTVVRLLRNGGGLAFTQQTLVSQATTCATPCSPIYFPAISTQNSPWGLALGDADGDGDRDLFLGDRALYIYLYRNDGSGNFTLQGGNTVLADRPNVYLRHDTFRSAVGFTPSLAAGDVDGDGRADLAVGLHSGTQAPASATPNDGLLILNVTAGGSHRLFGPLGDVGTVARGAAFADANGDGNLDLLAGEYDGKVVLLRQLPPRDTDGDRISDYVDNAPNHPNAPRLDLNTDGAITYRDQLDNDFDTVLGNPEDESTWVRLGDVADLDDDNDGVTDAADACPFTPDAAQANADADAFGDACDALDARDTDGDGVPDGPGPGDPLYLESLAAKRKWSSGTTHFVLRIDALGRFFQNEFTQLMTDAAILSPAEWALKCWENYDPGDVTVNGAAYEPCGDDATKTLTLAGGKQVPISLVVIPKQLWTDPPVVAWINDRNDNARFELGQHGTYHPDNTMLGDWASDPEKNFYSCETCGLTEAENVELLKVGRDTLIGAYENKWVAEAGATATSPEIDWTTSAHPLLSYAAPFNTSDATARKALAMLGFRSFSASVHEEEASEGYGEFFADSPSSMERFGPSGMFHASADVEFDPPETVNGTYDPAAYRLQLEAETQVGGLNTWLIEEVEWSGRPCNDDPRIDANRQPAAATCTADTTDNNRENNTVYQPRWDAWLQLLDYVKTYPGGVVMTLDEVALAHAFDNAPTVPNPDQADADADGVGDVIDDAALVLGSGAVTRNQAGTVSATLTNGGGSPVAGQTVTFAFDPDGDGTDETATGTTDTAGAATVTVTATRPIGTMPVTATWDGVREDAAVSGSVQVGDTTSLTLDPANPSSGQVTDAVTVAATLRDSDGTALVGRSVTFTIGNASGTGTTDASGRASASLVLQGPPAATVLTAAYTGEPGYGGTGSSAPFDVNGEVTTLTFDATSPSSGQVTDAVAVGATLRDDDGNALAGRTVTFSIGSSSATGTTNGSGRATASVTLAGPVGATTLSASFAAIDSYEATSTSRPFTVHKETSVLTLTDAISLRNSRAVATATLRDGDAVAGAGGIAGRTLRFQVQDRVNGKLVYVALGTAVTDATGSASIEVPTKYISSTKRPIRAIFDGDVSFLSSTADAFAYRR